MRTILAASVGLVLLVALIAPVFAENWHDPDAIERAAEAKDRLSYLWSENLGIWGMGIGADTDHNLTIDISADPMTPEQRREIPQTFDGFPIVVDTREGRPTFNSMMK
jgi:hypothetical protein